MPPPPPPGSPDTVRIAALEAHIAALEAGLATQMRLAAACRVREQRLTALATASQAFAAASADLPGLCRTIAEFVAADVGDLCSLGLVSPDGALIIPAYTAHRDPERQGLAAALDLPPQPVDAAPIHQALRDGRPRTIPVGGPADARPLLPPACWPYLDRCGVAGLCVVPLVTGGTVIGALTLARTAGGAAYAPADLAMLQELADRAALALAHAQALSRERAARDDAFALLDTIFATVPVGLGVLDTDLRYIRVNQALAEVDGLLPAAYPGHTPAEIIPALAPTLEPILRQVLATGVAVRDCAVHGVTAAAPGEPRDWQASYYLVRGAHGDVIGVGAVVVEVTERVRAQQALEYERQQLAAIVNTMHEGVVAIRPDGALALINPAALRLRGFAPAHPPTTLADLERAAQRLSDLQGRAFAPGELPPHRVLRGERFAGLEVCHHGTQDQAERWLLLNGTPVYAPDGALVLGVLTFQDITQRKQAEAALRAGEERHAFLLRLSDRLHALDDPEAIQFAVACALGEHLGVSRVGYAEAQADDATIVITRNYTHEVPSLVGRYHYDDYGPELLRAFQAGRVVVRPDIAHDPTLTDAEKAAHAALQLGATVNMPLLKAGRLVAVLFMHHHTARPWSAEEITLLEDVVARTWDAVERARAEAALRQQTAMLDHAHVFVRDAESRIIFWNQGARRLYGWTAEEAIGQVSHDLLQTRFPTSRATVQAQLFAAGRWEGEVTHHRQDGSEVVVASLKVLFRDPAGTPSHILEVNNDVTALKRAEQALRERDEQLRLAYDAAQLGTWRRDLVASPHLLTLDARAQAYYGFSAEHIPIDVLRARVHLDDRPQLEAVIAAVAGPAGQDRAFIEYRIIHPSGAIRWLAVHIAVFFAGAGPARHPTLAIGAVQDVTARKEVEAALRASEERFRLLAEQAQDMIYRYRLAPEPGFEYVSPAATALTGYTPEEHYADPQLGFKLVEPEDRPLLTQLANGGVGGPLTLRWRRKDGAIIWTEQVNRLFVDAAGRPVAIEGIARDITARKAAEGQVRSALAAEQRSRAEAELAAEQMRRLQVVTAALAATLTLDEVVQVVLDRGQGATGATVAILALVRADGDALERVGPPIPDAPPHRSLMPLDAPLPLAEAARTRAPVWLESPALAEAAFPGFGAAMGAWAIGAYAGLPLVAAGGLLGVLALGFATPRPFPPAERALLRAMAQQYAQAIARARLYGEVQEAQARLQQLSQRLLETQEQERRHLARELHDEVGQELTGLRLALELAAQLPAAARDGRLADAHRATRELIGKVRALSLDLRPAMLDDMGLLPALLWQLKRYGEQTGVQVDLRHWGLERRLPTMVETVAYRVVQEALTNIARHAGVRAATVSVLASATWLQVQIRDAGCGFDLEAALAAGRSSGLPGMQERVSLLRGTLSIEAAPGAGTCVTVRLPLPEEVS